MNYIRNKKQTSKNALDIHEISISEMKYLSVWFPLSLEWKTFPSNFIMIFRYISAIRMKNYLSISSEAFPNHFRNPFRACNCAPPCALCIYISSRLDANEIKSSVVRPLKRKRNPQLAYSPTLPIFPRRKRRKEKPLVFSVCNSIPVSRLAVRHVYKMRRKFAQVRMWLTILVSFYFCVASVAHGRYQERHHLLERRE